MGCAVLGLAGQAGAAPRCEGGEATRKVVIDARQGGRYGDLRYGRRLLADKEVALTFDDGPRPGTTPAILATLREHCVRATFFMIGQRVDEHPEIARQVLKDGHTIGSHSWSHRLMPSLAPADQVADFDRGFASLEKALGRPAAPVFRFPQFKDTPVLLDRARVRGVAVISTDVSSEDWRGDAPDVTLARIYARLDARGSGILILHDAQANTAKLLPALLEGLRARGYRVVQIVTR